MAGRPTSPGSSRVNLSLGGSSSSSTSFPSRLAANPGSPRQLDDHLSQHSSHPHPSPNSFENGLWTCPHRTYTLGELSLLVDPAYDCIDLHCCNEPACRRLLEHELHWTSSPCSSKKTGSKGSSTTTTTTPTGLGPRAHVSTTIHLLSTTHRRTAATPRKLSTMRRDFTAARLHELLREAAMPICTHSSLSDVPVQHGWSVDFLPLRKGNTVYSVQRRKCFSRYWECVQCRYGGTETGVGFEARVVEGERAGERRRRKSTVLELVVCVKRDVGVLLSPVGDGLRETRTESEELSRSQTPTPVEISRSSSWETHAVTSQKLRCFKEGWGRWVGRLRLANEECGMRWLLEGLSRLATVQGVRGWIGYIRGWELRWRCKGRCELEVRRERQWNGAGMG